MKRYALYFSAAFLCGTVIVLYLPALANILLARWGAAIAVSIVISVFALRYRQPAVLVMLAGVAAGLGYVTAYTALLVRPLTDLHDQTMPIQAVVRAYPEVYADSQRAEVTVDCAASGIAYPKKTFSAIGYLPLTQTPLRPGDTVQAEVSFYVPDTRQGFDRQRYQMGNGNFISFSYVKAERGQDAPTLFSVRPADTPRLRDRPLHWARQWGEQLVTLLPEREGGFLRALLLGDKQNLQMLDELRLRKAGLSHVIAVSGMHLMFLVGLSGRLFSRKLGVPIAAVIVLLFIPMAGASPSILRAGIMTLLSCLAFFFDTVADSETSLGIALLVLLLWNPYALFSLSLQLSFLSTFGILRFAGRVERTLFGGLYAILPGRRCKRGARLIGATVSCSACAVLATTPVLISAFGYLTLLSIPANLLTFAVIGITFELGVLLCLIPALHVILVPVLTRLVDYILGCANLLGDLQWGILYWEDLPGKLAVVAVTLLVLVLAFGRWSHPRVTAPILCLFLAGTVWSAYQMRANTTYITLHAVGDGQMITVSDGYAHLSLIDCGSSANQDSMEILTEYMYWNGFDRIDTMILTAVDKAHARASDQVVGQLPVGRVILPPRVRESDTLAALQTAARQAGLVLESWDAAGERAVELPGVTASVIGGVDRKLGVRLTGPGTDLLVLHSMTQTMLDGLLSEQPLQADAVVLANQFEKDDLFVRALDTLQPEVIYLSTGFGTASKLRGVPVYSTADAGDLVIAFQHE